MKIEEFYNEFIRQFKNNKRFFDVNEYSIGKYGGWTKGISNYIKKFFEENMECDCVCKNDLAKDGDMKEFLTIDFTVFKGGEMITLDNLADEMLIYAVEHENDTSYNKIAYNISKLLNVKAENKVMIGYITEYKTKLDTKQKKEKVFEKINEQLKKIPAKYFRSEERLLKKG